MRASNVRVTRSLIRGQVNAGDGQQTGLVISDSEINCGWSGNVWSDTGNAVPPNY